MAAPAQLVAEAVGDGYLRIGFQQDGVWMKSHGGREMAVILLQYPRQGEMMRNVEDYSETEHKAKTLNDLLGAVNGQLRRWCS